MKKNRPLSPQVKEGLWINNLDLTDQLYQDPILFNQVMSNLLRNLNDEDLDATLEERIEMSFPHLTKEETPT